MGLETVAEQCARMQGSCSSPAHPLVVALTARILAEEALATNRQRTQRWQAAEDLANARIDDPTDTPGWICDNVENEYLEIDEAVALARRHLAPIERRFYQEAKARWPGVRFRRYAPVEITVHSYFGPSVWYAPFLCRPSKLIVVIQDRDKFPYRIYSQNRALYEQHGYTVLDFSEDFSCPADDSVWNAAMARVGATIGHGERA